MPVIVIPLNLSSDPLSNPSAFPSKKRADFATVFAVLITTYIN